MKIGFMGMGKLGLPCALAIESQGHEVLGYDINPRIADILKTKKLPYREAGAQELLDQSQIQMVELPQLARESGIIFMAIETPHGYMFEGITRIPSNRKDFNYSFLRQGLRMLDHALSSVAESRIIVVISTVLPGTIDQIIRPNLSHHIRLCYNPFFIAMGTCIHDFLNPEFVLLGGEDQEILSQVEAFYQTLHQRPVVKMSIASAELTKVAYNTFIGMKIVFANTLMEICHKLPGPDVDEVTSALALATDRLISSRYLTAGMGDGGGCHPRDSIALSGLAQRLKLSHNLFGDIMKAREDQTEFLADVICQWAGRYNQEVTILGEAFKAETNLTVGSPSILLKNILDERELAVISYDPWVRSEMVFESRFTDPGLFFIGTCHEEFKSYRFPPLSTVIDPFRYISPQQDVQIISIGRARK